MVVETNRISSIEANLEVIDLRGGSDGEASPHMKHRGKKPDGEGKTGFKRPGPGRPKMGASQSGQEGEKNGGTGASRQLSKEGAKAALKRKEQKAGSDNQKRGTRASSADLSADKKAGGDSKRLGDAGTEDAGKAGKPTKTKSAEKGASGKPQLPAKTKKGSESGASSVASKGKVLKSPSAGQHLDQKGAETTKPPASGDSVAKAGSQLEQARPLRMSESTGSGKDGGVRKRKLVKLSLSDEKAVGGDQREAKRGKGASGKIKGREVGRLLEDAEQAAPDTPRTRSSAGGAQTASGVSSGVKKIVRRGPGRPPKAKVSVGKPAETQSLKKGRDANRVLRKSKILPPRGASKVLKKEVRAKASSEQGKQKSKPLLKGLKAKRPQEKGATTELSELDEKKAGAGTASKEEEETVAGESKEKGGKAVEGAASKEGEDSDKEEAANEEEGASKEGGSLENESTGDKITVEEAGEAPEEAEASEQKDDPEKKTQEEPNEQPPKEDVQGDPSDSETESDDIGRASKAKLPAPEESDAQTGGKEILAKKEDPDKSDAETGGKQIIAEDEDAPETEPDRNGAGGLEELKGAEQLEQPGPLDQTEDVPGSAEAFEAGPSAVAKVEERAAEGANTAEEEGQKEMKEEEKPAASAEDEPSGEQKDALRSSPALTNAPSTAEDGDKVATAPVEKASAAAGDTEASVPPEMEAAAENPKASATTESGTPNLKLELEEGEESGGKAEDQEEVGKESRPEEEAETRPKEQAETESGERESRSEEEGGQTGQENEDGEKTPEASGRSGGEAEEPKVPEDRVATRGLGRRERVPVKRSWDEEEILPQRTKQEKPSSKTKGGFRCDICGLVFGNGQALGGHKGSHKPTDSYTEEEKRENTRRGPRGPFQKDTQKPKSPSLGKRPLANVVPLGWPCEICGLVFPTGQALGGHKGSHKSTYYYSDLGGRADEDESGANGKDSPRRRKEEGGSIKLDKSRMSLRPKDRLQSLAAMLSKRSRRVVSTEAGGEQEREKSSKRIAERLKRAGEARRRAEEQAEGVNAGGGTGPVSPPGQRGKGMDSFEEDAVAGLMVLRQPIILAAEKAVRTERHRRKRARVKSSPTGAPAMELGGVRKSDDASTLAAAKVLVGKNGLLEEEAGASDPGVKTASDAEGEKALSSGEEKSGKRGDGHTQTSEEEKSEEEKPRRPETRTKEERRVTRKLRDSSDEEDVWRPRIRDRAQERKRPPVEKKVPEKRQRPRPKTGLLSELVRREGSLTKEAASAKETEPEEKEASVRDENLNKKVLESEEKEVVAAGEGQAEERSAEEPAGAATEPLKQDVAPEDSREEKGRHSGSESHSSDEPLGFRVPVTIKEVPRHALKMRRIPISPEHTEEDQNLPFLIPVTEEPADAPQEFSDEERELLPLSKLKVVKRKAPLGPAEKLLTDMVKILEKGNSRKRKQGKGQTGDAAAAEGPEKKRRKRREDAGAEGKKRRKKGGEESRSGSPLEEFKSVFAVGLKRAWEPAAAEKTGGSGFRPFVPGGKAVAAPKIGARVAKTPKKGSQKPPAGVGGGDSSSEDAPIGLLSKIRSPEKKRPPEPLKRSAAGQGEKGQRRRRKEEDRQKSRNGILALPANGGSRVSDPGSITEANSASESEDVPIGKRVSGYTESSHQKAAGHAHLDEEIQRAVQESVAMLQQLSGGAPIESGAERRRLKKEGRARKRRRKEAAEEAGDMEEPGRKASRSESEPRKRSKSKRAAKDKDSPAIAPTTPPSPDEDAALPSTTPPRSEAPSARLVTPFDSRWPYPSSSVNEFLEKLGLGDLTGKMAWAPRRAVDDLGPKPVVGSGTASYTVLTEDEACGHGVKPCGRPCTHPLRTQLDKENLGAAYLALRSAVEGAPYQSETERLDLNVAGGLGLSLGSASGRSSPSIPFFHALGERPSSTPPLDVGRGVATGRASPELGAFYRDKGVVKNGKWLPMHHPQEKDLLGLGRRGVGEGGGLWSQPPSRGQPDLPAVKTGLAQFLQGVADVRSPLSKSAPQGGTQRAPSHDPAYERLFPERQLDLNLGVLPTAHNSSAPPSSTPPLTLLQGHPPRERFVERDLLSRDWQQPPSWLPPSLEGRREILASKPYAPPRFDPRDQTGISGPPLFRGPQPDVWKQKTDSAMLNPDRPWPNLLGHRQEAMNPGGRSGEERVGLVSRGGSRQSPGFLELHSLSPSVPDGPLFSDKEISAKRAQDLPVKALLKEPAQSRPHKHYENMDLLKSAETLRRLLGKNENMTSPAIRSYAEGVKNMLLEGSKLLPDSEVHEIPDPEMLVAPNKRSSDSAPATLTLQRTASGPDREPKQSSNGDRERKTTSILPGWLASELEKRKKA